LEDLVEPNFHDGHVDGVLVAEGSASIFLRTVSSEKFTIVLRGVKSLVMNDFRQGNIILDLEWVDAMNISDSAILDYYWMPKGEAAVLRERWIKEIKGSQLHAIEISPSYGANLTAIFRDREIISGFSGLS
jgi:hypothetical protein